MTCLVSRSRSANRAACVRQVCVCVCVCVSEWVSEWVSGPGRLLLGVFWLSRLGRQTVSVRARVEPLLDPHSRTWTQAAISTVIILTTSSLLSGDETNSTTFGNECHSRLELTWCSDGTMHYETVHSGSEEVCVCVYVCMYVCMFGLTISGTPHF
jgi:hypothetical protein